MQTASGRGGVGGGPDSPMASPRSRVIADRIFTRQPNTRRVRCSHFTVFRWLRTCHRVPTEPNNANFHRRGEATSEQSPQTHYTVSATIWHAEKLRDPPYHRLAGLSAGRFCAGETRSRTALAVLAHKSLVGRRFTRSHVSPRKPGEEIPEVQPN